MTDIDMERDEFEAIMVRNTARFGDILSHYVKQLSKRDRLYLTEKATEIAFTRRAQIGPQINVWWDECCHLAAQTQDLWNLTTLSGFKTVRGSRLGRGR